MKIGTYLLWAAMAVGTGIIVLLGYFVQLDPIPADGLLRNIFELRLLIMGWAVLLAAVSLGIGLFNLFLVHWTKVSEQGTGWKYSALLIVTFVVTLILGLAFGPDSRVVLFLFNSIQLPVETSLIALLAITLSLAGFRLVAQRRDLISLVFVGTALLVLIGSGPGILSTENLFFGFFAGLRNWLVQVVASGGARGILLGVALGSIVTGLRVLLAVDRPYGE
ncbi:MAG: hypothetical protein E3J30_07770 [Anaerolineales bacterium]|nr:MAG: hypothetical protein E3J30_07770 [Anaerolineales bacterium]